MFPMQFNFTPAKKNLVACMNIYIPGAPKPHSVLSWPDSGLPCNCTDYSQPCSSEPREAGGSH